MNGRRGFLGGLLALPFAAKAVAALPAPEVPLAAPPVAVLPVAPLTQRFMVLVRGAQNVGTPFMDGVLPMPPVPSILQAFYNPGPETVYVQAGSVRHPLPPGKSGYAKGERLIPCPNPHWAAKS